jgi:hypothetical protein
MTDDPPSPALLPAGLADLLPPEAEREAALVEAMAEIFARHGYDRVKPPLLEFEDSLFAGSGAALADQTFRLMDPISQRMMGLRADTTPQVARIAATRLARVARPLRLSYAGQVLRVRGTQLAPSRQLPQAGIELIGPDLPDADAEVAAVAAEALAAIGIADPTLDITLPRLSPALLDAAGVEGEARRRLARALDRKDAAAVTALARDCGPPAQLLPGLLAAAGPAEARSPPGDAALPPAARAIAGQRRRRDRGDPRPRAGAAHHARPGGIPRLPLSHRRRLSPSSAPAARASWRAAGGTCRGGDRDGDDALSRCAAARRGPRRARSASSCPPAPTRRRRVRCARAGSPPSRSSRRPTRPKGCAARTSSTRPARCAP